MSEAVGRECTDGFSRRFGHSLESPFLVAFNDTAKVKFGLRDGGIPGVPLQVAIFAQWRKTGNYRERDAELMNSDSALKTRRSSRGCFSQ
jgi:hypothetical protein